jgi:hypothetical protein
MIGAGLIVGLIAVLGSLFLAMRALRSHRLPFETMAMMAVAWVLIIAVVAFVATRMGA